MASVQELHSRAALTLVTLGAASVSVVDTDGQARTLGAGKPLAMLAYLAFSPGRQASRDALLDLLWADVEPESGRHAMRQAIWYVRKRLGDSVMATTRDSLRVNLTVESDRDAFIEAIELQRNEAAVGLYRGDFLPGIAMPGAVEFEHWCELERQRLRMAFVRAAHTVVRDWLSVGRHRDAIALARRVRDVDRTEANWRLVIESLIASRDSSGLALEIDALRQDLASEDRQPEPATNALIRAAEHSDPIRGGDATVALVAELIGRETEFAHLMTQWERAKEGASGHVVIRGSAGIGKSRLMSDFSARLRSQRARLAVVSGRPGERFIPFSLAGEIAGALARLPGAAGVSPATASTLVALSPGLSATFSAAADTSVAEEALRRRSIAVRELVSAVAEERPVALVIDDLHWADDWSQRLLTNVIDRMTTDRVLIVTAVRDGYLFPRSAHTFVQQLTPLAEHQVAAMIASIQQPPDGSADLLTHAVHMASAGSPLLVLETLQWMIDAGISAKTPNGWVVVDRERLKEVRAHRSALAQRLATLTPAEREALRVIATAGLPLPPALLERALGHSPESTAAACESLERRGFLNRSGPRWNVSHDAIADALEAALSTEERAASHLAVGRAWAGASHASTGDLLRGGRHLLRAGAIGEAGSAFTRWVSDLRRHGDARNTRGLASEFAGPELHEYSPLLAQTLPVRLRLTRLHAAALGAVLTLAIAAAILLRLTPVPASPLVTLFALQSSGSGETTATQIGLTADAISAPTPIVLKSSTMPVVHGVGGAARRTSLSPDGRRWAGYSTFADSGGIDLVVSDVSNGTPRRITRAPHDDFFPVWSPDGRSLLFETGRFDALNHNKLAILDLASGRTRQLTFGPDVDGAPAWNPRGDLIAFTRRYWARQHPVELCLVTVDATLITCRAIPAIANPTPVGWYDDEQLLVSDVPLGMTGGGLALVNTRTMSLEWLRRSPGLLYRSSPDGRWIACLCSEAGTIPRWRIFSVDRPAFTKEVVSDGDRRQSLDLFWLGRQPGRYYTRAQIHLAGDHAELGVPTKLRIQAYDAMGDSVTPGRVRWSSDDPSIATVDSEGILHPRHVGEVTVRASLGGWIETRTIIRITPGKWALIDSVRWISMDSARFDWYGEPHPSIVNDPRLGRSMSNNGDGSFTSGAFSRTTYDASRGLGAEFIAASRIDAFQWQRISIGLSPDIDSVGVATWDHRTGSLPAVAGPAAACQVIIPSAEGPDARDSMVIGSGPFRTLATPFTVLSGSPYKVRVQILPDGRCAVAINGRLVGIHQQAKATARRYRLIIDGNSVGTRILVGRIDVWSGVRPDVRWEPPDGRY